MALKLSIFTTLKSPYARGDNVKDALACYKDLADEVVIVDGTYINGPKKIGRKSRATKEVQSFWPKEFNWSFIGQQFQKGYAAASGDWVIHCDLDFLFHERDFGKIRQALKDYPNSPAVSFYKHQFIQPHKYNLKSRLLIAANKRVFGDRLSFSGGGDLTQLQLDHKDLDLNEMPQAGVPIWNYEHLLKTDAQIKDDISRMDRAYQRHFGRWLYSQDGTVESAYDGWWQMIEGRYAKPQQEVKLKDHPKYIQDTIRNLKPNQFGYNGFGKLKGGYFEKA